ncbi:hypothetical protein CspeluHIS016_0402110 [Cutaneotrichosporon spelunceum]|uniref:Hexosyltransferase n=1 Tax=Cutaneotrichosporon spelunceum TaxID=1672016 RepID=A0AAD3TUX2_9TREE|nr:hypothetical protein CspeluHIS016_0402110 [Cutaneotrichosporon spelunceum]
MSRRSPRAVPRNFPLSSIPLPAASPARSFRTPRLKTLAGISLIAIITLLLYAFYGHHVLLAAKNGAAEVTEILRDDNEPAVDVQRSFEEPDFALLSSRQPHEIGCDVPLDGEKAGPLIFLGIFSSAPSRKRRDLYRHVVLPDFPSDLFTVKFILGQQAPTTGLKPEERIAKASLAKDVEKEMAEFGDMVMLDIVDNIDDGKTHEYFKWVAHKFAGEGQVRGRPRFVMKADDDTYLVMPNIVSNFMDLDCSRNYYWGTSAGRSGYFDDYFRGLAYAISWPLVSWIGNADMPHAHVTKIEDARTGQWLRMLDKTTDPVTRFDLAWNMGDWNQLSVTVDTVALHWLKADEWVEEQVERIHNVWKLAGRPFEANNGVARHISIASGKRKPEAAAAEEQRQKEMGWDVKDNVVDM